MNMAKKKEDTCEAEMHALLAIYEDKMDKLQAQRMRLRELSGDAMAFDARFEEAMRAAVEAPFNFNEDDPFAYTDLCLKVMADFLRSETVA